MASYEYAGFNTVATQNIISDDSSANSNVTINATGNVEIGSDTIELSGDIVINSNLAINDTVFIGDLNVFREFAAGHTISYGMRISDDEKLQFYKHDTRQNKAVLVSELGIGAITADNTSITETTTGKLNGLFNKANKVSKRRNPSASS
jgi:hypothetical protein|tara:strand:+ start:11957 stop:12403 length:447 start_codon:yes stop_codon:yes gene_type:complete